VRDKRKLTPRQIQVLEKICLGKSNKEIGKEMGLTPLTVMSHVHRILGRLGADNRTQAVTLYLAPEKFLKK